MSGEICTDNRFEIIAAYKKKLIESTNIQSSPEEMAVIDNVLFRFWQMRWLPHIPHGRLIDADALDYTMLYKENWMSGTGVEAPAAWKSDIDAAPTIIPAEEVYGQFTDTAGNLHWTGTHSGEHIIPAEEGER